MGLKLKLYTDECVAKAVISGLRKRGVDVLSLSEARMLGESDEAQLSFAHDEGRVILTHDDDFLRLHAASRAHAGVIYALREKPIGDIIHGVMLVYQLLEADEMIDHVEFL